MKRVIFVCQIAPGIWSRYYPDDSGFAAHEHHLILHSAGNAGQMIQQMVEGTGVSFAGIYPDRDYITIYVFETGNES